MHPDAEETISIFITAEVQKTTKCNQGMKRNQPWARACTTAKNVAGESRLLDVQEANREGDQPKRTLLTLANTTESRERRFPADKVQDFLRLQRERENFIQRVRANDATSRTWVDEEAAPDDSPDRGERVPMPCIVRPDSCRRKHVRD